MSAATNSRRNIAGTFTSKLYAPTISSSSKVVQRSPHSITTTTTKKPSVAETPQPLRSYNKQQPPPSRTPRAITDRPRATTSLSQPASVTSRPVLERRRSAPPQPKSTIVTPVRRIWNLNKREPIKEVVELPPPEDPDRYVELATQTHEPEIIDHDLIVGDWKGMLPSPDLVREIERCRETERKKAALRGFRIFEEYAKKEEEHLTDLQEFLDTSTITKRLRRPARSLETDHKTIRSMDELLRTDTKLLPMAKADLRERFRQKEEELLQSYDAVADTFKF